MLLNLRKKQAGIGLLELMLSLAIIAVLIIMATRYYQSTRQSQLVSQAVDQVNAVISAVGNWRVGVSGYTGQDAAGNGLSYETLYGQGYLPKVWGTTSATASPWSSDMSISPVSATSYTIVFSGIPDYACSALQTRLSNTESVSPQCSGGTLTVTYDESAAGQSTSS